MRYLFFLLLAGFNFLVGCHSNQSLPADARKPIPIVISRFDLEFFALDTNFLNAGFNKLTDKYPDFLPAYLVNVLGIYPADPQAPDAIKAFLFSYRPVYQSAQQVATEHLPVVKRQLEEGMQWLRYLVPTFQPDSPFALITFIGPMDAFESFAIGDYGDVRTGNGVGVALQLHLGGDNPLYEQGMQNGIFYYYQVRRFTPETIVVNAMKNLIEDHFPYTVAGKPMMEEMVEKGKRMYLLKRTLPQTADSLLIGYTGAQLTGALENESLIWQFFVKNDLLYSNDPVVNQQYIRDGPKTPELGEASPGYIGLFTGWRIVEAFMKNNNEVTIDQLMDMPANTVFQQSGYKPR